MSNNPIRITLIGPPACGKGTQSELILKDHSIAHISTGDLLRNEVASGTQIGKQAQEIIKKGELVPDDLIIAIVRKAIIANHSKGFILDGFPRTVKQAELLDQIFQEEKLAPLHYAIEIQVPDADLIKRVTGRRVHVKSGRTYHVDFNPPKVPMIDDVTGEPLIQRSDDTEDSLKVRLKNYHNNTEPMIAYYKKKGVWEGVDGSKGSKEVYGHIKPVLSRL